MKAVLASHLFNVEPNRVRILVEDVGGGFGGKNSIYPEQVLVLHAARRLGRPVKWVSDRTEAFISDFHGRDNLTWAALALDADGRIQALKVRTHANIGAYTAARGTVSPVNGVIVMSSCYRIPAIHVAVDAVYTNTVPTDPYRGAGRPEVIYMLERLMDCAADQLGLDRVDFRRRNLIPRDAFPYATPTGLTYDEADFEALLAAALEQTDWAGFEERRATAAVAGRLRGIGMANYLERCGGGPGLGESARLEMDGAGRARLFIGSMANGQGHQTAFMQVVHEVLGLPPEDIEIIQGDTDQIETGTGTGGSWSIPLGSGAIVKAGARLIDQGREIAASALEVAAVDVSFEDGAFRVTGTDLIINLTDVAKRAAAGDSVGLSGQDRFEPDNYTFPYGCHIAEVEIDPETGVVSLIRYDAVHDFGRALNPALLGGQVHGGVAQGIGQALLEHTFYDRDGQLLAGSFLDYGLPRAGDLPDIDFHHQVSPTTRNPYGIKGCGEAGATGSPPAVMNAVIDALRPYGIRHVDMPATPERVWQAIRAAAEALP
jgi:carbon-monoxide dehydrogenase large subunit